MKSVVRRLKENKLDVCVWAGKRVVQATGIIHTYKQSKLTKAGCC